MQTSLCIHLSDKPLLSSVSQRSDSSPFDTTQCPTVVGPREKDNGRLYNIVFANPGKKAISCRRVRRVSEILPNGQNTRLPNRAPGGICVRHWASVGERGERTQPPHRPPSLTAPSGISQTVSATRTYAVGPDSPSRPFTGGVTDCTPLFGNPHGRQGRQGQRSTLTHVSDPSIHIPSILGGIDSVSSHIPLTRGFWSCRGY